MSTKGSTLLGVLVALSGSGCRETAPASRGDQHTVSTSDPTRALAADAALEFLVDPPAPSGDLRAEIDRFTSLDQCVAEHAALDPLVADALGAIGYDTFVRDTCRLLQATKEKSREACKPIVASPLRDRCEAFVATSAADPEACPMFAQDTPARGREPSCVAIASRDPRLCAATTRADRALCEALAANDSARCAGAIDENAKSACKREATRWKHVLEGTKSGLPPFAPTHARLSIHPASSAAAIDGGTLAGETDLSNDFARGVVVVKLRDGVHVNFGAPHDLDATTFAPSPGSRTRFAFSIVAPDASLASTKAGSHDAMLERAELAIPGAALLIVPGVPCSCDIIVTRLDAIRGGAIALRLSGTIGTAPRAYEIDAEVTTFVRDVVVPKPGEPHAIRRPSSSEPSSK